MSTSTSGAGVPDQFLVGLRVLVVHDDPTCLMILEKMLRNRRTPLELGLRFIFSHLFSRISSSNQENGTSCFLYTFFLYIAHNSAKWARFHSKEGELAVSCMDEGVFSDTVEWFPDQLFNRQFIGFFFLVLFVADCKSSHCVF